MWAYAHMVFQNHSILPAAFLDLPVFDLTLQRAFMVASDLVAQKHINKE